MVEGCFTDEGLCSLHRIQLERHMRGVIATMLRAHEEALYIDCNPGHAFGDSGDVAYSKWDDAYSALFRFNAERARLGDIVPPYAE